MAHATFATLAEARASGYVQGDRPRLVERYRGCEIRVVDVSGPNAFGYRYAIAAYGPDDRLIERTGYSVPVWLAREPNAMGDEGAATAMFPPDVYRQALERARQAIDRFLEAARG